MTVDPVARGSRLLVVVARAAAQAPGLTRRLEAAGYAVLEVPVLEVVEPADDGLALRDALGRLAEYDWLVVTSPNGAARVRPALEHVGGDVPKVAVVGPGTEEALGRPAHLVAGTSVGEGLVADLPAGSGRVLLVQAEAARPVVAEGLRAKGWAVDTVVGYRTRPCIPAPELLAQASGADAVVVTSGSTVRHLAAVLEPTSWPPIVVSIGPVTTEVAVSLGISVTTTASVHTLDGVVDSLLSVAILRNPD